MHARLEFIKITAVRDPAAGTDYTLWKHSNVDGDADSYSRTTACLRTSTVPNVVPGYLYSY